MRSGNLPPPAGSGNGSPNRSFFSGKAMTPLRNLLLLALIVVGVAGARTLSAQPFVELRVATVAVDLQSGAPLALLHADWEEVLPIWIGEVEAGAISDALRGITFPRPLTHDLLASVVGALGGELEEIRVTEIREATYYAVLRIRVGGELREVDARPSDALALAVRTGARIQVARSLLEGAPDAEFVSLDGERPIVRIRGITATAPTAADRSRFGFSDDETVMVLHAEGGVGSREVRRGDAILEVEGRAVAGVREFLDRMTAIRGDGALRLRILRDGEVREVELPPRRGPARVGE